MNAPLLDVRGLSVEFETRKGVARVLVSGATREACRDSGRFTFIPRGQFHVKGREQPVELFEPAHALPGPASEIPHAKT